MHSDDLLGGQTTITLDGQMNNDGQMNKGEVNHHPSGLGA